MIGWRGLAKRRNSDVVRTDGNLRDQLIVENEGEQGEEGDAAAASPHTSAVQIADHLNKATAAAVAHY